MSQNNSWPEIEDRWGETTPMSLDVTPPLTVDELKSLVGQRHPHIGKIIDLLWGYEEMNIQFGKWGIDERGDRSGFDQIVLDAMLQLSIIHLQTFNFNKARTESRRKNSWPSGSDALR